MAYASVMRYRSIQEFMKAKNMTEAEMAEKLGVSQAYVNRLKHRKYIPSWRVALKLREITGIPLERLIGQERASA